jgi:HSP20 family protein
MLRIRRIAVEEEVTDLHRRMEQMMERLLHGAEAVVSPSGWAPRADIYETADHILVVVEVPGVERSDIEIVVQGRYLRVSGTRGEPSAAGCMRWHQMEIAYGPFERVVALPAEADPERIEATYRDGFLRIQVVRGAAATREVPIETP